MSAEIWSIGHSNHSYEQFLHLLKQAKIEAIADVRSVPYSKRYKTFSRELLCQKLKADNIAYVFLGDALGGRPKNSALYHNGIADYDKIMQTTDFQNALTRLIKGSEKYRIAIMCAEADPLKCHRCLLVARALRRRNITVSHILSNGEIIGQREIERDILQMKNSLPPDLFKHFIRKTAKS